MLHCQDTDGIIRIETDALRAEVWTRRMGKYLTGICPQSFVDKRTGFVDPTYGLLIMDFLLAPGWRDDGYPREALLHGDLPKHFVEGPQICLQMEEIDYEVIRGREHVAVKVWTTFTRPGEGYRAGSRYEQTIVFLPGRRYLLACEVITSANDADNVFYRMDIPGHIKHNRCDSFTQVYLSYHGTIDRAEFLQARPPDGKFLYKRDDAHIPERFIRGYQLAAPDGAAGPWLAGMTLDPAAPCEAWCHQHKQGYVCFIQENHGRPVTRGRRIGAAYVLGYFDSIDEMHRTYDRHKGAQSIHVDSADCRLTRLPRARPADGCAARLSD